jgi:hypothetical protein
MSVQKRHIFGLGALFLILGVMVAVGIYLYHRNQVQRELAEVLAGLDQADPGWRLEGLEGARPPVPREEDSAALILQIHRKLPPKWLMDDPEAKWGDLAPNEPLPPQEVARFEPRMAQLEPLVADLRLLAHRPHGRFAIIFTKDMISTLVPHVQNVREVADVLEQYAFWQAHHGDFDGALLSCRAGCNAARSLDGEPLLISQLVRSASLRITLAALERTLAAGESSAASLRAVQETLADAESHDSSVTGLRGERAGMHMLCSNLENGTVPPSLLLGLAGGKGGPGFNIGDKAAEIALAASVPASHVWILQFFNDALEMSKLPGPMQETRMDELHRAPASAPILARVLCPAVIKCHTTFRRTKTHLRCATVAVAVERYRLRHGRWPADLAALRPEFLADVPLDPYTDEPLKYRKTGDGIVVYSVGPDGTQKGDYHDRRRVGDQQAQGIAEQDAEHEFRLWDPEARQR